MDPNELPDVIRFQAQRQLSNMGDSWTLDYVLLPDDSKQEMLTALVGVLSPAVQNEIEAACTKAGLQLTRIAVRPLEIARFATRCGSLTGNGAEMVVCLSKQHADLITLMGGQVIQIRSTKLPSDPDALTPAIGGELRRSLMAGSSLLAGQAISRGLLFASPALSANLEQAVSDALGCDVACLDPARLLSVQHAQAEQLSLECANRVAALAGAMGIATADKKTLIDFKAPKKRPPPKSRRSTYVLAGAAAALLALAGGWWWISANRTLDDELAFYQAQVQSKEDLQKISEQRIKDLAEIDTFLLGSPHWLDELKYIAEKVPEAEKILVRNPSFRSLPDGSGQIVVQVLADSSESISEFEGVLRDENHIVKGTNIGQMATAIGPYNWEAMETITVRDRGWKLVSQLDRAGSDRTAKSPTSTASDQASAGTERESLSDESQEGDSPAEDATEEIRQSQEAPPIPDNSKQTLSEGVEGDATAMSSRMPSLLDSRL
jgi:hypothetical protein